jgi:hypothetical protein
MANAAIAQMVAMLMRPERGADMGALAALFKRFLQAQHCWQFRRGSVLGAIPSLHDDAGEADAQYVIPIARHRVSKYPSYRASAAMQAAKAVDGVCFLIRYLMQ